MEALRVTRTSESIFLTVEELSQPIPQPGESLVKIRASAVQPSDMMNSRGGFAITTFPRRDFAGTIISGPPSLIGKHVFGTSGNDFSFTKDGAQAEYAILQPEAVALKPKGISFEQAALLGTPFTTANIVLQRATFKPGETVLVLGAMGSVGTWVMKLAQAYGCKTIGVGRHGTDIDSTQDPTLSRAKELTGGKGPDIAVDTVGDFALTKAAFDVLGTNGRLCTITSPRSGSTELPVDILSLYRRQISLIGCNSLGFTQVQMARMLSGELVSLIESGKLKVPELGNTTRLSIDQALGAYNGKVKKAVVVFDE